MDKPGAKWIVGIVAVLVIGGVAVFGFMSIQKASEPEIDRSKPPASFYGGYTKGR